MAMPSLILRNNICFYKQISIIDNIENRIYLPIKENNIFEIKPLNDIEIFIDNSSDNIIDYLPKNYNSLIKLLIYVNSEYLTNPININFDSRVFGYNNISKIRDLVCNPGFINLYELFSFNNGETWSFLNINTYDYNSLISTEFGIKKPIIEDIYITDECDRIEITSSQFENINSEFEDNHISTSYQIYEDLELNNSKMNYETNKTLTDSIIDISSLNDNSSYYATCKYIGLNFESQFSDPYKFKIFRGYDIEISKEEFLEASDTIKFNNLIIDKFKDLLIDNNISDSIININSDYGNSTQYGLWPTSHNSIAPHLFSFKSPDDSKLNSIKCTFYCGANSTNNTFDFYITSKDIITPCGNNEFAVSKPICNIPFITDDCVTQSTNTDVSKKFTVPYDGTLLLQLKVVQYASGTGCVVDCKRNNTAIVNSNSGKTYWGKGYNTYVTVYNGNCNKGDIITVSGLKYTGSQAGWASKGYIYVKATISTGYNNPSNNLFYYSNGIANKINYGTEYTFLAKDFSSANQIFNFISPVSNKNITNSPIYLSYLKLNFK